MYKRYFEQRQSFAGRFRGAGYAEKASLYRELLKPALRLPETTVPVEGIPMHYSISRHA